MLVLAKPRLGDSGDVILEDDDATEVYLERPHTDLIPHLNRSLSARDRRRERVSQAFITNKIQINYKYEKICFQTIHVVH